MIMAQLNVDQDFIPNFKLKLTAGRNFSGTRADSASIILNETALKQTGIKDPIGKRFKLDGTEGTIIGIVKDFNITSIREPIMPLVIFSLPNRHYQVHVHTTAQLAPAAVQCGNSTCPPTRLNTYFSMPTTMRSITPRNRLAAFSTSSQELPW